MANIAQKAQDIRNEVNGKDVREALASGIEAINTEVESTTEKQSELETTFNQLVINAGNSNAEIVAARGGEVDLPTRLNKVDSSLAENVSQLSSLETNKMEKTTTDISVSQINKNLGKFDQTYMSDELLAQIAGTSAINATPSIYSITSSKMVNKSIVAEKTDFIEISSNMIDKDNLIPNTSFDSTTGEPIENLSVSATGFILIAPNTQYMGKNVGRRVFYDESKAFISTSTVDGAFTTPSNAVYVRLAIFNTGINEAQLNLGNTLLAYEPFYKKLEPKLVEKAIDDKVSDSLATNAILFGNTPIIFNLNTKKIIVTIGGGFLYRNMRYLLPSANLSILESGTQQALLFNFKTQTYLVKLTSELTSDSIISKDYIGIAIIDMQNNKVFALGNYEVISNHSVYNKLVYFPPVTVPTIYNAPLTGLQTDGTGLGGFKTNGAPFTTLEQVYAKYDELVTLYPSYVTKTLLGKDSSGVYDIFSYTFSPEKPTQYTTNKVLPKMIFTTNTHGHEKLSVYALYWLIQDICKNWKTNDTLEYLRWNVKFVIVPIVNPYGFVNEQRVNANGVDLNRNADYLWESSVWNGNTNPLYSDYKGTAPFSEVESQYIRDILLANKDAIYYADYHTNAGSNDTYTNLLWHVTTNDDTIGIARHNIGFLTRKWQKEFVGVDQNMNYIGYSSKSDAPYFINYACKVLGILSATPECFQRAPNFVQNGNDINRLNLEFVTYNILNVLSHCKTKF